MCRLSSLSTLSLSRSLFLAHASRTVDASFFRFCPLPLLLIVFVRSPSPLHVGFRISFARFITFLPLCWLVLLFFSLSFALIFSLSHHGSLPFFLLVRSLWLLNCIPSLSFSRVTRPSLPLWSLLLLYLGLFVEKDNFVVCSKVCSREVFRKLHRQHLLALRKRLSSAQRLKEPRQRRQHPMMHSSAKRG